MPELKRCVASLALTLLAAAVYSGAQTPSPGYEHFLGGFVDAPVRLEVFSDFQCPACREFYMDTIRPVLQDYCPKGKVSVIYREFPLPVHQYARDAARYAVAARKLGRAQWQAVVDALYTNQPLWSRDGHIAATVAMALSAEDFARVNKTLADPLLNSSIDQDVARGQQRDVKSTPTVFVTASGKEQKVVGGIAFPVLREFIDRALR